MHHNGENGAACGSPHSLRYIKSGPEILYLFEGLIVGGERAKFARCRGKYPERVVGESDKPIAPLPEIGVDQSKVWVHVFVT